MVKHNANYANGKVYGLYDGAVCVYVGSTTQTLEQRYSKHKHKSPEHEIRLIEKYPCKTRFELETREEHWRKQLKPRLNRNSCCSGIEYANLTHKQYCKLYIDKIREQHNAKMCEMVTCECGIPSMRANLSRHKKRAIHHKHMVLPHLMG